MIDNNWQHSTIHNCPCKVIEEQTLWGQTVCRVWLPNQDAVVRVPRSALRPRGELTTALIVDGESILRLRIVKTGGIYQKAVLDGQTFILQTGMDQLGAAPEGAEILVEALSGLSLGDEVVLDAPDVAREGDRLVRE